MVALPLHGDDGSSRTRQHVRDQCRADRAAVHSGSVQRSALDDHAAIPLHVARRRRHRRAELEYGQQDHHAHERRAVHERRTGRRLRRVRAFRNCPHAGTASRRGDHSRGARHEQPLSAAEGSKGKCQSIRQRQITFDASQIEINLSTDRSWYSNRSAWSNLRRSQR